MMDQLQIEVKMIRKKYSVSKEAQDSLNFLKKSKKKLRNLKSPNYQSKISQLQGWKGQIIQLKR